MYLMFGDEADKEQTAGKKFFVYGAVFVPTNSMASLHAEIEKARKEAALANTDSLKSSSNSRPEGFPPEKHRDLKNTVMKLAREVGNVKFCAQVTLHELARNQEQKDLVLFGANTILGAARRMAGDGAGPHTTGAHVRDVTMAMASLCRMMAGLLNWVVAIQPACC